MIICVGIIVSQEVIFENILLLSLILPSCIVALYRDLMNTLFSFITNPQNNKNIFYNSINRY